MQFIQGLFQLIGNNCHDHSGFLIRNVKPLDVTAAAPAPAPAAKVDLKAGEPVKSPMPGNIIRVEVKEGDQIKAGQLLVVLEAMKMENEILAPHDGTVAQVIVSKGSTVETDSPLIVLA